MRVAFIPIAWLAVFIGIGEGVLLPNPARGETVLTDAEDLNQLRVELGGGGPGGAMAVRYSRVLPSVRTRIEPAIGLAYTGVLGSLLVTQPFVQWSSTGKSGRQLATSFEGYAGYSVSVLRESTRHPWTGSTNFFPNGNYHWLDVGLSLQGKLPWFIVTAGIGATILLSGPAGIGGPAIDEETFWWIYPEGWVGRQRWGPALWSSIGWAF